ncbi:MAG: hypothetical protein JHD16_08170 [Solirubrobacteraceae bacterium]|nr:hypothetical protein [Solirubrobacteraceae bacterium]
MRTSSLTVAALLAATTLAGCGGVDKNAYVDSVTNVQETTQKEATALSTKMQSAETPAQVGANLEALAKSVEKNAVALDKIEAPEEVAAQHQEYVKLMKDFSTNLEKLAVKVEKATPTTVPTILTDASKLTTQLSTGETKIVTEINNELQN